jgi:signal transduction histidine kinase
VELDNDLQIYCDFEQIQQVIINVLLNAIQALKKNNSAEGRIDIYGQHYSPDSCSLKIIDNGRGMNKDELEKIFVPFYTTKKQGSGIGLSVSRQIMRLNNGSIHIDSKKDVGTRCELLFMKNFAG